MQPPKLGLPVSDSTVPERLPHEHGWVGGHQNHILHRIFSIHKKGIRGSKTNLCSIKRMSEAIQAWLLLGRGTFQMLFITASAGLGTSQTLQVIAFAGLGMLQTLQITATAGLASFQNGKLERLLLLVGRHQLL